MRRAPLSLRVFAVNAAVLCVAAVALAVSPATVSAPVTYGEALTIVAGLALMLLLNLWLVRRALGPLAQLSQQMRRADLLQPAPRLSTRGQDEKVATLTEALNSMLDRLEAERKESAGRALQAQEAERLRVARELHDEVGQTLTGLLLQVDAAMRECLPGARGQMEEVRSAARESLEDVRRIAQRLRPEALEDLGLKSALVALTTRLAQQSQLHVVRDLDPDLPSLGSDVELAVYRVAQEALTNVARHARADTVEVGLRRLDGHLRLTVRDDGRGLDGASVPASGGLRGMRERALLVGGALSIEPASAGGTQVRLDVPLRG
ncbi:MAG TPA: HAMP domain-containing sensor histidine kinase [Solirubrobacteraceae bacterium]|nr:HAMP domain-containing sensor histidine kinase [Solirubrobacteraceae bacterium]